MTVVSNTSPIVNLAAIGALDLLRKLYGTVLIPPAVYAEICSAPMDVPGAAVVRQRTWIQPAEFKPDALTLALSERLHPGEAEAIALASHLSADLLLLDERRARKTALRMRIPILGVLGCLIEAKRLGHVPSVKPLLQALKDTAGFHLADDLAASVLERAGE
jgi:predicted nucleic acid-binding protein